MMSLKTKPLKTLCSKIGLFFALASVAVFELGYRSHTRLGHDFISYVLPARAAQNGNGFAYSDYYINRPPTIFIFLENWGKIFGFELWSWVALETILLCVVLSTTYSIFTKILSEKLSSLISILMIISMMFSGTFSMFLPSELIGISLLLFGLKVLAHNTESLLRVTISFALFALAAGVREQFILYVILTGFTVVILRPTLRRAAITLFGVVSGVIGAAAANLIWLYRQGNTAEFFEVFKNQSEKERRPVLNYPRWLLQTISETYELFLNWGIQKFLTLILIILFLMIGLFLIKNLRALQSQFLIFSSGFSLIGTVAWQSSGHRFHGHYAIISLLGLVLCFVGMISLIERLPLIARKSFLQKGLIAISLLLITPSQDSIHSLLNSAKNIQISNLKNVVKSERQLQTSEEKNTLQILSESPANFKCTLTVYGWGTGSFYFYTNSKPCTRFFIPNIVPLNQVSEYQTEILKSPPRVIRYGCLDRLTCSDLDVLSFETNVFPFQDVLKACYKRAMFEDSQLTNDVEGLYESLYTNHKTQTECIQSIVEIQND